MQRTTFIVMFTTIFMASCMSIHCPEGCPPIHPGYPRSPTCFVGTAIKHDNTDHSTYEPAVSIVTSKTPDYKHLTLHAGSSLQAKSISRDEIFGFKRFNGFKLQSLFYFYL